MKTKVKICGMTRLQDALLAAENGADFLGYIFTEKSKRFLAPRSARLIINEIKIQFPEVLHVGIFVDAEEEDVAWSAGLAGLDYLQLHGKEKPEYCKNLELTGFEIIKAFSVGSGIDNSVYKDYDVAHYLWDTYDPVQHGGTGKTFDLSLLPSDVPLEKSFIAGGLRAENVGELLKEVQPFAVDVSSGVEDSPGVKNERRIEDFMNAVRQADGLSS